METLAFDILLTHSSRPVDLGQCSFEALSKRYADPQRLVDPPPFEALRPIRDGVSYEGA
jgi:hypothetical protein